MRKIGKKRQNGKCRNKYIKTKSQLTKHSTQQRLSIGFLKSKIDKELVFRIYDLSHHIIRQPKRDSEGALNGCFSKENIHMANKTGEDITSVDNRMLIHEILFHSHQNDSKNDFFFLSKRL